MLVLHCVLAPLNESDFAYKLLTLVYKFDAVADLVLMYCQNWHLDVSKRFVNLFEG